MKLQLSRLSTFTVHLPPLPLSVFLSLLLSPLICPSPSLSLTSAQTLGFFLLLSSPVSHWCDVLALCSVPTFPSTTSSAHTHSYSLSHTHTERAPHAADPSSSHLYTHTHTHTQVTHPHTLTPLTHTHAASLLFPPHLGFELSGDLTHTHTLRTSVACPERKNTTGVNVILIHVPSSTPQPAPPHTHTSSSSC